MFQRPYGSDGAGEIRSASVVGRYWVNFATTGDPNGDPHLPNWPALPMQEDAMLEFADDIHVLAKTYRNAQLDLLRASFWTPPDGSRGRASVDGEQP